MDGAAFLLLVFFAGSDVKQNAITLSDGVQRCSSIIRAKVQINSEYKAQNGLKLKITAK